MISFKQFLTEMPQMRTGTVEENPLNKNTNDPGNSIVYSNAVNRGKKIGNVGEYELNLSKDPNQSRYRLLDHTNKHVLFMSNLNHKRKSKDVPFAHVTQEYVSKKTGAPISGANIVYDIGVNNQKHPLVSDVEQYEGGHKMWSKLIDMAHKQGHHAYHLHGGKLTRITPENKEEIMTSSYLPSEEGRTHRYVLSKTPLE